MSVWQDGQLIYFLQFHGGSFDKLDAYLVNAKTPTVRTIDLKLPVQGRQP
jgi:hypothetical protein